MVTDRDIVCKGLASHSFDAGRATARDVMTEGIHCCREDDDLAKAMHHMEKLQVRRLPVINKSKRMVGIISLGDVGHSTSGDMRLVRGDELRQEGEEEDRQFWIEDVDQKAGDDDAAG